MNIINDPAFINNILPLEREEDTTARYRQLALRIHPDRLTLDGRPQVSEIATRAFQRVGQRLAELEKLRLRNASSASHRRPQTPPPDY